MRAFSPSLLAYFAALSATGIRLVDSAAIPRSQEDAVSRDASTLAARPNSHVVIFNDGGRPRWGFVIPNRKRSSKQAPPTMPVPPKLAKAGHAKSKGKAKPDKNKGKKASKPFATQLADDKKSSKPSASHSSSAHYTHPKHVPGSHHRDSRKGDKKGGRNVVERRMKMNKRHSIVTVALGNGRYGHKYETSAIMWHADPSAQDSEKDRRSPKPAHPRDLASHRRRHSRHGLRYRALLDNKGPTYNIHSGAADIAIPIANDVDYAVVAQRTDQDDGKHRTRDTISADVPGTVDIKTTSDLQIKLASLVLAIDPSTNTSFVMNANNNTATPVYLHVIPGATAPPDANGSPVKVVSLRIPVFDRTQAAEAEYCAQFDPIPTAPAPLTAERCLDNSVSPANLTNPPLSHASQSFAYTPSTGAITPIWLNGTTLASGAANSASIAAVRRSDDCDDDDASAATTQLNAMNGTSSQTNDTTSVNSNSPQVVGVMMYFEIYSVALGSDGSSTTASASGSASANGGGSDDVEGSGDDPGYEDTDTESSDASDENSVSGNVNSNASVSASPPSADTPATSSAPTALTGTPSSPSASSPSASTPVPATPTAGSPIIQANVLSAPETPSPNSTQHDTPAPAAITVTMSPTPSSTPCSVSDATHTSPSPDRTATTTSKSPADASAGYEWLFTPDGS